MNHIFGPAEIRMGDVLITRDGIQPSWVAQKGAHHHSDVVLTVRVMHIPDGGIDDRAWTVDSTTRFVEIDVTSEAMQQIRQTCRDSPVIPTRVIRVRTI